MAVKYCRIWIYVSLHAALSVQYRADGAVHAGIVSKDSEFEFGVTAGVESRSTIVFCDSIDQDLSGFGDTTANDDDIRIYDRGNVGISLLVISFPSRRLGSFRSSLSAR